MMSEAEEKFMTTRRHMEYSIQAFFEACGAIDIDEDGFIEDVGEAITEAVGKTATVELD